MSKVPRDTHGKEVDIDTAMRKFMTPSETVRMGILLTQHCLPLTNPGIDGDSNPTEVPTGFYRYEPGWDDEKIAKETNPRLDEGHVIRLRRSLEMKLEKQPRKPRQPNYVGSKTYKVRFNTIERQLEELEARVTSQVTSNATSKVTMVDIRQLSDRLGDLDERTQRNAESSDALLDGLSKAVTKIAEFRTQFYDDMSLQATVLNERMLKLEAKLDDFINQFNPTKG